MATKTTVLNKQSDDEYIDADRCGYNKNFAWVLDGANGLGDNTLDHDYECDSLWLTETLNYYLFEIADKADTLVELFEKATRKVKSDYEDLDPPKNQPLYEQPSTTVAAVQVKDNKINYLILADSSVIVRDQHNVTEFVDNAVPKLDEQVINYMQKIKKNEGLSHQEAWSDERFLRKIRENRKKYNRIEGYRVLSMDPSIVKKGMRGSYHMEDNENYDVLLATDGFTSAIHTFSIFNYWEELFDCVNKNGLEEIYKKVKQCEEDDLECMQYPRFAPRHEMTAVYIEDVRPRCDFARERNKQSILEQIQKGNELKFNPDNSSNKNDDFNSKSNGGPVGFS